MCEEHILNTTSGLVTRYYIDELWELAVKKIVNQLKTYSAYCTDAELSLKIKNTIVLFCHTMKVSIFYFIHHICIWSKYLIAHNHNKHLAVQKRCFD